MILLRDLSVVLAGGSLPYFCYAPSPLRGSSFVVIIHGMKTSTACLVILFFLTGGTLLAEPNVLWYQQPAGEWTEALPIGNGRLGAMVFGGVEQERLALNDDTLWSGGPKDCSNPDAKNWLPKVRQAVFAGDYAKANELCKKLQGPFTQSYQPLGDALLEFDLPSEVTQYRRQLDLRTGVVKTTFRSGDATFTRQAIASAPDNVIALRLTADKPGAINFRAKLDSSLRHKVIRHDEKTIVAKGRAPSHVEPNYRSVKPAIVYEIGGGMAFVTLLRVTAEGGNVAVTPTGEISVTGSDSVTLLITAATSFNGFDKSPVPKSVGGEGRDPLPVAEQQLASVANSSWQALLNRHTDEHAAMFDRVAIDLGPSREEVPTDRRIVGYTPKGDPGLVALVFQYGRYLLMASSRPGTQPANLQGIWNHEMRPPWSSNWTLNINSEMNYWPAGVANLSECREPMIDFIGGLAKNGAVTASVNYGLRGWCAHHNSDIWRQTAAVGDYGEGDPRWANWNFGGVWHCQDLIEHYRFTQDKKYLAETAWPLMRGAAEFCLGWLVEDPRPGHRGKLATAPSTSAENVFRLPDGSGNAAVSATATQDIALIRELFAAIDEAAEVLGKTDDPIVAESQAALARLPDYQIGSKGQLQEWEEDFEEPSPDHRHVSHLIGLFPGRHLTPQRTPPLADAVERTLELRGDESTGWSMAWKVNLWARLGDGDHALRVLNRLLKLVGDGGNFAGGGVYANLFDAHPPFQIDGNFGATAGVAEMLLQSHRRSEEGLPIIHLLPALPATWPAGEVSGLRCRGGFEVDFQWKNSEVSSLVIRSERGGKCELQIGEVTKPIELAAGESQEVAP